MKGESSTTSPIKSSPQRITPTNASATLNVNKNSSFSSSNETTAALETPQRDASTLGALTSPSSSTRDSCVQVAVRIRPVLSWEKKENVCKVVHNDSIQIGGNSGPRFTFDRVFDPNTTQAQLFKHAVEPLVQKCLQGYNATIFAYGQTGSGKTHTILGPADSWETFDTSNPEVSTAGVLPRALHALFAALEEQSAQDPAAFSYSVTLQFLEVYGEDLRDLLAPRTALGTKLTVREYNDEPEVPGAVAEPCLSAIDATRAVERGSLRRVTAATAMNATSSRSHALLTVALEQKWEPEDETSAAAVTKRSKFHFCDLAGSERQKRTLASGQRLKEGININQGLLVLGNVISALASNSSHIPYRDSKLTRLLKGSLGGNHQTLMMACVSPAPENMEESLNCLRYANRAKNIQNSAIVNLDANSRRVLQLQQQIMTLAQVLLNVVTKATSGTDETQAAIEQIPFSRDELEILATGSTAKVVGFEKAVDRTNVSNTPGSVQTKLPLTPITTGIVPTTPWTQSSRSIAGAIHREDFRLKEMEARISSLENDLFRTQNLLKESQECHDAAELELHRYRAMERLIPTFHTGEENKENSAAENFLEQATAYEQEISLLKKELQKAERKASRLSMWQNIDVRDDEQRLRVAEATLKHDQERLSQLQSCNLKEFSVAKQSSIVSSVDTLDDEEKAEEEDLEKWTKKYLAQGGHVEDDDAVNPMATEVDAVVIENDTVPPHMHLENDLLALSRSIEERENLIRELKESQEKYASMREFYEEKLQQMETELREKEEEREQLVQQLQTAKTRGSTKDLQERLREKERYIASLREKQKELRSLTSVSHRNEMDIVRLRSDVTEMKRRRVVLQKELASERKKHANEVKQLQKNAIQKEREINKIQKISNQREMQAKKASLVAKARLEELNALRAKNRESERKLRMQSVKKGMMEKAGIDSVLVGQRLKREPVQTQRSSQSSDIDADALRSLFDKKISDVVRKETLADKLAEAWEEHYDLSTQKQELLNSSISDAVDDIQAISIKIKYKQDRIRQLAKKFGKQDGRSTNATNGRRDYDLFDEQYHKLCKNANSDQAQKTLVRVLFGMVVRERRRISALARTASSLDDKLQQAEKTARESEMYLRAYMDEHRHMAAELSNSQQKNILSLMEMVKSDSKKDFKPSKGGDSSHNDDMKLLVLANERIALLENQIQHLESDNADTWCSSADTVRLREAYNQVCASRDEADSELKHTFGILQNVQDQLSNIKSLQHEQSTQSIMRIIEKIVSQIGATLERSPESSPTKRDRIGSDSDVFADDGAMDDPDWASELMEELAFIAEGKVPQSVQNLSGFTEAATRIESTPPGSESMSVFDRLTNPENFTGTQKRKAKASRKPHAAIIHRSKAERTDTTHGTDQVSNTFSQDPEETQDFSITPTNAAEAETDLLEATTTSKKRYKSVFDRLVSPSQATGTQRQKLTRKPHSEDNSDTLDDEDVQAEDDYEKMLDDALGQPEEERKGSSHGKGSSSDMVESPVAKEKRHLGKSLSEYAEQDVFERLQRTSTVSYLNRQGEPVKHGINTSSSGSPHTATDTIVAQTKSDLPNKDAREEINDDFDDQQTPYTRLNVFERLQKTTTEAYAKKVNRPKASEDASH